MIDRYIEETLPHKPRNRDSKCVISRLLWWKDQIGSYALANVSPDPITGHKLKLARSLAAASQFVTP